MACNWLFLYGVAVARADEKKPDPRDKRVGQTIRAARGDLSQSELAEEMRAKGHKWRQATVWAVESGIQPLRVSEAGDLAEILSIDFTAFEPVQDAELFTLKQLITEAQGDKRDAEQALGRWLFVRACMEWEIRGEKSKLHDPGNEELRAKVEGLLAVTIEDVIAAAEQEMEFLSDAAQENLGM